MLSFGKRKFHTEKWALKGVDFELFPGQALGIIGINGAGKSTLLKILTGTSTPTTGSYEMRGSVSSMLELGSGFHPAFTGRSNIYMAAAMQGIPKAVVDARYPEIAEFSELGEQLKLPLRTYSSGQQMRLGFSSSMLINPDVLILDEILAVGDAHFRKKCMDQFNRFRAEEKTILFVSHSIYQVREICDRVIWLHDGQVVMDGDPIAVTDEYENRLLEMRSKPLLPEEEEGDEGTSSALAKIHEISVHRGDEKNPVKRLVTGEPMTLRMAFNNPESDRGALPIFTIIRNDGLMVCAMRPDQPVLSDVADVEVACRLPAQQILAGEYSVCGYLTDATGAHIIDQRINAARFRVAHSGHEKGVYLPDATWELPE